MLGSLVRRLTGRRPAVDFCDECGQACTGVCRSDARLDDARTSALRSRRGVI